MIKEWGHIDTLCIDLTSPTWAEASLSDYLPRLCTSNYSDKSEITDTLLKTEVLMITES